MNKYQQIRIGAFLSYLGIFTYILIGLLYTPWMIKMIGKDNYGLYTLAYSIISFFVFDFGISAAIQRFVSKYLAEGNQDKINKCISLVYKLYIYIDLFLVCVLISIYFLIPSIYRELTDIQIEQLKIVFIIASGFSVISFPFIPLNGILSAHEKFIQLKTCDLLSKILTVTANIICLYLGGQLYALVITNVVVGIIFIVVKYIIVKKETNISLDFRYNNKSELINLLSFSGWVTIVALCQRCIFNIAPSILGFFASAELIAILGIAITLEAYTYTFAYALNGMFLPKISRLLNNGDSVLPLMIRVGRIQIFLIGLLLIGFIVVGEDFINSWLGNGFELSYACTLLFIIPGFFLLPADVADQTLIASGNVKYRAYVYIITAIVNISLSLILTYYFKIMGLAISIFASYMIRNIFLYIAYATKLHIDVYAFLKQTYVKMSIGLVSSLVLSLYLTNCIPHTGWSAVLIKVGIVAVTYISLMYIFALNNEEKNILKTAYRKIIK